MTYCDTCGNQFSDICGNCEGLDGVPVKYTEKGSKPIVPICGTCVSKDHCAVAGCNRYEKRLKLTNAERIRNMTDEELAILLGEISASNYGSKDYEKDQTEYFREWLKQEVDNV